MKFSYMKIFLNKWKCPCKVQKVAKYRELFNTKKLLYSSIDQMLTTFHHYLLLIV